MSSTLKKLPLLEQERCFFRCPHRDQQGFQPDCPVFLFLHIHERQFIFSMLVCTNQSRALGRHL